MYFRMKMVLFLVCNVALVINVNAVHFSELSHSEINLSENELNVQTESGNDNAWINGVKINSRKRRALFPEGTDNNSELNFQLANRGNEGPISEKKQDFEDMSTFNTNLNGWTLIQGPWMKVNMKNFKLHIPPYSASLDNDVFLTQTFPNIPSIIAKNFTALMDASITFTQYVEFTDGISFKGWVIYSDKKDELFTKTESDLADNNYSWTMDEYKIPDVYSAFTIEIEIESSKQSTLAFDVITVRGETIKPIPAQQFPDEFNSSEEINNPVIDQSEHSEDKNPLNEEDSDISTVETSEEETPEEETSEEETPEEETSEEETPEEETSEGETSEEETPEEETSEEETSEEENPEEETSEEEAQVPVKDEVLAEEDSTITEEEETPVNTEEEESTSPSEEEESISPSGDEEPTSPTEENEMEKPDSSENITQTASETPVEDGTTNSTNSETSTEEIDDDDDTDLEPVKEVAYAMWNAFYVFLALFCACIVALIVMIAKQKCRDDPIPPPTQSYSPRSSSYHLRKPQDNPAFQTDSV